MITLMILTSVLVVVLGVANLIIPGITMNRTQSYSLKAYFASETGAERSLWSLRKDGLNCAANNQCINFSQNTCVDCLDSVAKNYLNNGSSYSVEYASSTLVTLKSWGSYMGARRTLEIEVGAPIASTTTTCAPDCSGKVCGDDDGCGNTCPATCATTAGCSSSVIANATTTPDSCCSGSCYECNSGYYWDGAVCKEYLLFSDAPNYCGSASCCYGYDWVDPGYVDNWADPSLVDYSNQQLVEGSTLNKDYRPCGLTDSAWRESYKVIGGVWVFQSNGPVGGQVWMNCSSNPAGQTTWSSNSQRTFSSWCN